jgi:hypothetical protein
MIEKVSGDPRDTWQREFWISGPKLSTMGVEYPAKKLTMGYWNIRGLGAPMRMMAAYSGLPLLPSHGQ